MSNIEHESTLRRWRAAAAGLLALMLIPATGNTTPPPPECGRPQLTTTGPLGTVICLETSNRIRGEFVDWFDPGPGSNNRYNFYANRFQAGLRIKRDDMFDTNVDMESFFQFQHSLIDYVPHSTLGPGGVYRANTNSTFQQSAIFRQGWLKFSGEVGENGLGVMGGRTRFMEGDETTPDDPSLRWLKSQRISQRLIGPFDYTHVGRSFDGIKFAYDRSTINVTSFWHQPTSGGFEINGNKNLSQIDVAGVAVTASNPEDRDPTDARLFWMYYDDHRNVLRVDNRPLAVRTADTDATTIHTIGANAEHIFPTSFGKFDILAWTAGQLGEWQQQTQRAWSYDFEAGYQPDIFLDPWLRLGFSRSSGDPDPNDDTHESFFQMLPTARLYAKTPFYNMMNNQDLFTQFMINPTKRLDISWLKKLNLQTDFHWLRATEKNDFVYFGGGATKRSFFGYGGTPTGGDREIGYLLDVGLNWAPVDFLKFYAYYGHLFGQDIPKNNFVDENIDYGYIEMTVAF
jgi:hypothetical protein